MESARVNKNSNNTPENGGSSRRSPGVIGLAALLTFALLSVFAFTQPPRTDPFSPPDRWQSFFKPHEKNAFMRLPVISGNLTDVFALPGSELLWAVGKVGLILHSSDGGENWQQQTFPGGPQIKRAKTDQESSSLSLMSFITQANAATAPKDGRVRQDVIQQAIPVKTNTQKELRPPQQEENPTQQEDGPTQQKAPKVSTLKWKPVPDLEAVYFVDKNTGWIVGENGTILKTGDGGDSWQLISGSTAPLRAVSFGDAQTAVAVGEGGTILKTGDGGDSWQPIGGGGWLLSAVSFSDAQTAVAVGENGTILKTGDGGDSWQPVSSGSTARLFAVSFSDAQTAVAVGNKGTILKTGDGGDSWQPISSGSTAWLYAVSFSDAQTAVAVGDGGTILKTGDGGDSWQPISSGSTARLSAVSFSDAQTAVAVGDGGTILKTGDGGDSWQPISSGDKAWLRAVSFSDAQTAVAVGLDGEILKTGDGGDSWQPISSGSTASLSAVSFSDAQTAVAVSFDGTILKTGDGGDSWQPISGSSGSTESLYAVSFSDAQTAVAVGENDTILKTGDGGDSWQPISGSSRTPLFALLFAVSFSDAQTAVAVGEYGTILKTGDGGDSWQPISSGSTAWLYAVSFSDAQTAVAVGDGGTILKTGDGGDSWQPISSGSTARLSAVSFSDAQTAVAVGDGGTILKTSDGGDSWQPISSGSTAWLYAVSFSDAQSAVAVGNNRTILKTGDAGDSWSLLEYKRYPAPWYWLSCVLFALFASGLALRRPGEQHTPTETVADMLASDRPIQPGDPDPLDFGAIARGLSRFMRNPSTEPPLTVAITGAWGSGKSSLMNLLYHDLKQQGFTPVWFNAWHHQKGEQLLASLYANIRSQAIPGWFSFPGWGASGLRFRFKLFFCRSKKHWLLTALLSCLITIAGLYLYQYPFQLKGFDIPALFESVMKSGDTFSISLALLSSVPPVAALLRSLRAFGINPASLITGGGREKGQQQRVDPSARQRLANEFKEVTNTLELGHMVIFIDDLDRCSKENVVDILESINFLSVSGDCYIILGMDKGWVKICIEQKFPEMAKDNHDFASEYLEKLINIDVPVPILEAEGSGKLLAPVEPLKNMLSPWEAFKGRVTEKVVNYRYELVLLSLLSIGIGSGFVINKGYQNSSTREAPKTLNTVQQWNNVDIVDIDVVNGQPSISMRIGNNAAARTKPDEIRDATNESTQKKNWQLVLKAKDEDIKHGLLIGKLGDKSAPAELLLRLVEDTSRKSKPPEETLQPPIVRTPIVKSIDVVGFQEGQTDTSLWRYLLPGIVLIFMVIGLIVYALRKSERIVNDSPRFRDALGIWHPWITLNRQTPRTIKRYLNRVRYIAMRYREETHTEDKQQPLLKKLFAKVPDTPVVTDAEDEAIDESILVALSAIFAVDETWVTNDVNFQRLREGKIDVLLNEKYPEQFAKTEDAEKRGQALSVMDTFMAPLKTSLEDHVSRFGDLIFSDEEQRRKFLHILAATKVN